MADTTPAKKATAKKAANPTPDSDKVHEAARKIGDGLEAQRQERIAANTPVAPDPENLDFWKWLARPFDADWQEKLPRNVKKGDDDRGPCENTPRGRKYSADGHYCGGWHARSMHLDYIGHAGITMRLNEDVGAQNWSWEPVAFTDTGLPLMSRDEFWIKLTILGVSKYGVGDDFRGSAKQAIGDALRNAAMRFGLGTYLWAKSEKALAMKSNTEQAQEVPAEQAEQAKQAGPAAHIVALKERIAPLEDTVKQGLMQKWQAAGFGKIDAISPEEAKVVNGWLDDVDTEAAKTTLGERLGATEVDPGQVAQDTAAGPTPDGAHQ